MTDDSIYRDRGKFKKGHPGSNQHTPRATPPPDPNSTQPTPSDADTDFDAAILQAAASFGTNKKQKIGLAGYCASLRDTRPQDFAMLVAKAQARRSLAQSNAASAIPVTITFTTCPAGYFIPGEEARSLWLAKTGTGPLLVVDNDTPALDDDDPDDLFSDAPDDDPLNDAGLILPQLHQSCVARIENNRTAVALRFLTLQNITHYAPRARIVSINHHELHPLLFAPYIFVEMIDGQYGPIKRTNGIQSVVLLGDTPVIVPNTVITALKRRENANGLINVAPRMRKGIRVQITTGPFFSYEGVLASDPSQRVKVLFDNILGASREVSFPHAAVAAL